MKTKIMVFLVLGIISAARGQNTINLTFTAVDHEAYIRLDSIKVMNRKQGESVRLYWPDTTIAYQISPDELLLYIGYAMGHPVGIGYINERVKEFRLFQSVPNPVRDLSVISLYLPSKGEVTMMASDIRGRIVLKVDRELNEGTHSFTFCPGDERIYFITALWKGVSQSIKILKEGQAGGKTCKLEYIGDGHENRTLKQSQLIAGLVVQESGILDTPDHDTAYTFQFATNVPCPGTPTVTYEGQVYNTIQIFSQCWLKENLNVGTMIPGNQFQTYDGIVEKYCYNDEPDNCTKYGGLYQWNEMMEYTYFEPRIRGICPQGWHLPSDEEWKVLEGAVDSLYGIGDISWDIDGSRGYDAGTKLRATSGWYANGNGTDLYGFSALPGGQLSFYGSFVNVGEWGFWSSSSDSSVDLMRGRYILHSYPQAGRNKGLKYFGFSVRCIRDY